MAHSSKSNKSKDKKSVENNVDPLTRKTSGELDRPSRLNLDRQEVARITEQKIDEIESAIKQDYLRSAQAAKEVTILGQSNTQRENFSDKNNTILEDSVPIKGADEEFQPTLVRIDKKYSFFNDDLD